MSLLTVGSVAFDKLETPFGSTDKIVGGAATFITLTASYFATKNNLVGIVGNDFPARLFFVAKYEAVRHQYGGSSSRS